MTNSSNNIAVSADELYKLWRKEERDPTDVGFLTAIRKLDRLDRLAVRRVFERIAVDEETGDWIDVNDPVGNPKVWFRGRSEYMNKVVWTLFHGGDVPTGKAVSRIDGHLHSLHPGHLRLMSRGQATSLGVARKHAKRIDAYRLMCKYTDHSEEDILEALGMDA
jgi:hypothetical protein